mgnify:CR=1 FL=1
MAIKKTANLLNPLPEEEKKHSSKHLFFLALYALLFLSLISFSYKLPDSNWLGLVGYGLAWVCFYTLGVLVYPLLALFTTISIKKYKNASYSCKKMDLFYFGLALFSVGTLLTVAAEYNYIPKSLEHKIITEKYSLVFPFPRSLVRKNLAGVPLYYLYKDLPGGNFKNLFSDQGILLIFSILSLTSTALFIDLPLHLQAWNHRRKEKKKEQLVALAVEPEPPYKPGPKVENFLSPAKLDIRQTFISPQTTQPLFLSTPKKQGDFPLPPPSLLTNPKKVDHPSLKKELKAKADILEETLMSFGIEAKVGNINCGPTITSIEVHPAVGVKVQKITALQNDIALNMKASSMRIIAPIPGKAAVGIEIPSPYPQEVNFKEILTHYLSLPKKMQIPILLGKTVSGEPLLTDLAKMPHLLIAGATGSGKSVCINTLILSILMTASPKEIRLLMVDPKKVELTQYTNLPHMISPVITEAHGAYAALQWLVKEMSLRYELLKQLGLRNITAFNSRTIDPAIESALSIPVPEKMHCIVAIIDEFADLMMASSSDLETPIARIAQMARAVGIHLVLATQRPSREVITGLIKANFPTRIAFKVASRINSQIILDETGAENLVGSGDMLFLPPGSSQLLRAQGAYISDSDLSKVIGYIQNQAEPDYLIPSFDKMPKEALGEEDSTSKDALYEQAKLVVLQTQNASTTFLQRKLKIGYARAASLIDELEEKGIISAPDSQKNRRVLIRNKETPVEEGL